MRAKLTDTAIRSYQPRPAQYAIGDASCPGLCVRVTPKGVKTFAFAYRNKTAHKVEWLTLGRYPDLPLSAPASLPTMPAGSPLTAVRRRRSSASASRLKKN